MRKAPVFLFLRKIWNKILGKLKILALDFVVKMLYHFVLCAEVETLRNAEKSAETITLTIS